MIVKVYNSMLTTQDQLLTLTPVVLSALQDAASTTLPANMTALAGAPTQTDANNIIALLNACATALRNHGLAN